VVGAGVIGLAIARALVRRGRDVVVLEAEASHGTQTSSRNSEVIHAGLYYPENSLKARLCVAGKPALYRYCEAADIPHRRCGKLIVGHSESDGEALEAIEAKANANGVSDLRWLDAAGARALEPNLRCSVALYSPSSGIVDSHGFMAALRRDAEALGVQMALQTRLDGANRTHHGFELHTAGDRVECRTLINAAGLGAHALAATIEGVPAAMIPARYLTKGSYFVAPGAPPFGRLVYPVPNTASLGIHVTIDLAGQVRYGPDQEWVDHVDYTVDPARAEAFYPSILRFYPGLRAGSLTPAYAGVRPKVQAPGEPMADFAIHGPERHGVANLVNLFGMESPGLTAALAIADHVAALLE